MPFVNVSNAQFQSTLPRGERRRSPKPWTSTCRFNPRSREGSDRRELTLCQLDKTFQSTLPRGERRECSVSAS